VRNAAKKVALHEPEASRLPQAPLPELSELTARWARAKHVEETARREVEGLRAEIEPRVKIGYEDDSLVVGESSRLDGFASVPVIDNKLLEKILREEELLKGALEPRISLQKVRALAKLNPRVARVLEKITTQEKRFEQAAKKERG
jgi:hypothetical protein